MVAQLRNKLCGHVAEMRVQRTLSLISKVKFVTIDNNKLDSVAREYNQSRYQTVAEWLCAENYGSWHTSPTQVILDKYYKCDVLVIYKGYYISIDVTVNPNDVTKKQADIKRMSSAYSKLGVDKQVVLLVERDINTVSLTQALDNVIRNKEVTIQVI